MEMTESEIKASYSHAKHKATQIKILADLNDCSVREIKEILGLQEVKKPKVVKEEIVEPEENEAAELPIKIPDSIYDMAVERLEALEKIIDKANAEYTEIAKFLLMGA